MGTIIRRSASLRVAFSRGVPFVSSDTAGQRHAESFSALKLRVKAMLKRCLRIVARFVVMLLGPLFRPILFRARAYFVTPLQHEVVHIKMHQLSLDRQLSQMSETIIQQIHACAARQSQPDMSGDNPPAVTSEGVSPRCYAEDNDLPLVLSGDSVLVQGTRHCIECILKPGDMFIDVGADLSWNTLAALDVVLPKDQHISLMSINVKGVELLILAGMRDLLVRNPTIVLIVTFSPSRLNEAGVDMESWFKSFTSLGFDFRVIDEESCELRQQAVDAMTHMPDVNLFFARRDSPAWEKVRMLL